MPIDMLELAKRLIPDIETNMPTSVREAFDAGKVKAIFRTGAQDVYEDGTRVPLSVRGTMGMPGSHYFLLDDGRAARYGASDFGMGWEAERASVGSSIMIKDDPFVFDNIFFTKDRTGLKVGDNIEEALSKGISRDPIVGTNIYETLSKDGKIIVSHAGNNIKDVYTREGNVTFFDDAADPVAGGKPNLITVPIDDIEFVQKAGKVFKHVQVPRLKSDATAAPIAPDPPAPVAEDGSRLRGKGLPGATEPAPAPPPTTEGESKLRGKGLPGATEPAALPAKPIQMDMYHGGFGLDEGLVDPAKHSTARTPLPALTVSDEATARRYATTGGPTGGFPGGSTYKLGLEFDSPERIVGAFDPASDDFISFMRNTLPEEGVRAPLVPGKKPGVARYREIFDRAIEEMPEDDKTIYSVMDAISNIHDKYRPLGEYDYLPRAQGSIEAKRFGIDALTWNDHGDEAMGLLDPHDTRSKTGRVNIKSLEDVTETSTAAPSASRLRGTLVNETPPAPAAPPITEGESELRGKGLAGATEPSAPSAVTPAGAKRPMVAANYDKMSDEDLLKRYESAKLDYEKQLKIDPDGKAFMPTAKANMEGTAEQLRKRGIPVPGEDLSVTSGITASTKTSAVATETYDHAAEVAKATTSGEPLVESPPPKPARKGPADISKPTDIRTEPTPIGDDAAAPRAGAGVKTPDAVAEITTDAPKAKPATPKSSGAPSKSRSLLDNAAEAARNVAKGHGNARTLGIIGAATLLGVGYANTRSKNSVQRDQGTYMDQSRRDLGY